MKIKLLGINVDGEDEKLKKDIEIIATAGALSRSSGNVTDVYKKRVNKSIDDNVKFIERVIGMGHFAICEHIFFNIALEDVTPVVEQRLIMERFSAFTIKSRREVNFSDVGFYSLDFHTKDGKIHPYNNSLKTKYNNHMKRIFNKYSDFVDVIYKNVKDRLISDIRLNGSDVEGQLKKIERKANQVSKEDARYMLPYSYYSNILMTLNAHTLCDVIVDLISGSNSNITEFRELGEKLYSIMEKNAPYLKKYIDNNINKNRLNSGKDLIYDQLNSLGNDISDYVAQGSKKSLFNEVNSDNSILLNSPILISNTLNIDENIFITCIMRCFGYSYQYAYYYYYKYIHSNSDLKNKLIKLIQKLPGGSELSQVNFEFQLSLSYAALTHLTRHRTHHLLIPDFEHINNYSNYLIPKSIIDSGLRDEYVDVYNQNIKLYKEFKDFGVRDEDLIYFHLSGNLVNAVSNMDGETLKHISSLRACEKAQWEIRENVKEMIRLVSEKSELFSSILGPSCEVYGFCPEGRESCGKIKKLVKNSNE